MKTLACIVVELEQGERVEDFFDQLKEIVAANKVKAAVTSVEWKDKLKNILSKRRVPASCRGYDLLFYAVEVAAKNPGVFMNFIYDEVAQMCGEEQRIVESCIRYVTDKIVRLNHKEKINNVLGVPTDTKIKLTPSSFIKYLASTLF